MQKPPGLTRLSRPPFIPRATGVTKRGKSRDHLRRSQRKTLRLKLRPRRDFCGISWVRKCLRITPPPPVKLSDGPPLRAWRPHSNLRPRRAVPPTPGPVIGPLLRHKEARRHRTPTLPATESPWSSRLLSARSRSSDVRRVGGPALRRDGAWAVGSSVPKGTPRRGTAEFAKFI